MNHSLLDFVSPPCLGVVPIFVNAGAAFLPALVAGLASLIGVLLRPWRWWGLCQSQPQRLLLVVLAVAALGPAGIWIARINRETRAQATSTRRSDATRGTTGATWADVALEIIRQEERRRLLGLPAREDSLSRVLPSRGVESNPRLQAAESPRGPNASQTPPSVPAGAMMYRGDVSRCGYAGGPSPGRLGAVPLWQFVQEDTMYDSSPLVRGANVYVAACVWADGGLRGFVGCLDAATGQVRWETHGFLDPQSGQPRDFRGIFSSPALTADGQYLVIGQGFHEDANSELICLDARTGQVHWLAKTPLHIEGSPAIEGDMVVVGAGAIEEGEEKIVRGHPGLVLAVRISDGQKLWEYQVNDPEPSAAIADGVAYVGAGIHGQAVLALRTEPEAQLQEQGRPRLLWKASTPAPVTSAITVTDELVLAGCGHGDYVQVAEDPHGSVVALDRLTGAVRWELPTEDAVFGSIAVRNGKAFCPVRSGQIVAVDLQQSGRVLWSRQVRGQSRVLTGPAVTDEHVFVSTADGYLVVLSITDGRVLGESFVNAPNQPGALGMCVSSPFVAGGRVYVGSETGGLRCYTAPLLQPDETRRGEPAANR